LPKQLKEYLVEKIKLIEARKNKGYSQEYMASELSFSESSYCRKEKGQLKITPEEWKKFAELLGVPVDDIFDPDENQVFIYNEHSSSSYYGDNNSTINFSIPEFMLDALQKHIKNLEGENKHLKELLKQTKK
jgi:DNA-binding XRE family transcriptional regulator